MANEIQGIQLQRGRRCGKSIYRHRYKRLHANRRLNQEPHVQNNKSNRKDRAGIVERSFQIIKQAGLKFDAVTQRIIGSKQILYQWAMMDSNQVQSVIASNFQRSYRALAAGEKERQIASPGGCKQLETKKPLKIKGGE